MNIFRSVDANAIKSFSRSRAKNPEKMDAAKISDGPVTGCPILDEAAAYLECRLVQIMDIGGDHDIVLGEVVAAGVRQQGDASGSLKLSDLGWSYAG